MRLNRCRVSVRHLIPIFYLNISSKKELFKFFKDENKKLRKFKKGIIKYNLFVKNNKNEIIKETKKLEAKIENR